MARGDQPFPVRIGLAHETALELKVLLAAADNQYRDLFFGLPNSYGTLGNADLILSRDTRELPVHLARQRHPTVLNTNLD